MFHQNTINVGDAFYRFKGRGSGEAGWAQSESNALTHLPLQDASHRALSPPLSSAPSARNICCDPPHPPRHWGTPPSTSGSFILHLCTADLCRWGLLSETEAPFRVVPSTRTWQKSTKVLVFERLDFPEPFRSHFFPLFNLSHVRNAKKKNHFHTNATGDQHQWQLM